MNKQDIEALRVKILEDITPLIISSTESSADKFTLLIRLIQSGRGGAEIFQQAYASAKQIEGETEKLDALMQLLDEVELTLMDDEDVDEAVEEASVDSSEPVVTEQPADEAPREQSYDQQ